MKGPGILLIGAAGPETADGLRSLEQAGCRVLLAESAAEAIDMIAKEGLDAILVDLVSPGMDALRIATELRASGNHTQLPMLGVTTGSGAALAGALEAGYDGYVAAPVNHASFWREVSHILVERRSSRGSLLAPDWRMSRGKVAARYLSSRMRRRTTTCSSSSWLATGTTCPRPRPARPASRWRRRSYRIA